MIQFDNKATLTNTGNDMAVEVEIDNFREGKSFDAFLLKIK